MSCNCDEPVLLVEALRGIVLGVDIEGKGADVAGGDILDGVREKGAAELAALRCRRDGEPAHQHRRHHRITRQRFDERVGQFRQRRAGGAQHVEASDGAGRVLRITPPTLLEG